MTSHQSIKQSRFSCWCIVSRVWQQISGFHQQLAFHLNTSMSVIISDGHGWPRNINNLTENFNLKYLYNVTLCLTTNLHISSGIVPPQDRYVIISDGHGALTIFCTTLFLNLCIVLQIYIIRQVCFYRKTEKIIAVFNCCN